MKRKYIERCRRLRKDQTDAENKLWSILRNRQLQGVKFRRQFPIDRDILDFYCSEYKLAVEADGGQHYDYNGKKRDEIRAKILSKYEIEILRFSDLDILNNIEGVYEVIEKTIERNRPLTLPSPLRGEGKRRRRAENVIASMQKQSMAIRNDSFSIEE